MAEALSTAIVELKQEAVQIVTSALEAGNDPMEILAECRRGMTAVGTRFQKGDYFLAELLLAAELFKQAVAILEPHLARNRTTEPRGKVILATMRGDIHDLGKNIVATLLRAHAFEVHDLGVDVEPVALVREVEAIEPDFVGFSVLITTAFAGMKKATELLVEAGMRDRLRLLVGGGVTTPAVREYVGADFQTTDAMEGIAYCAKVVAERERGRVGR